MIHIVEDDTSIRDLLLYALNNEGFEAKGYPSSAEFYEGIKNDNPELIILDIMLPRENGISILENLRKNPKYKNVPIMMLTAKTGEFDKITGLDLGADDYVTKPFSVLELLSRIRALLRRAGIYKKNIVSFDHIVLNYDKRIAKVDDKEITLTYKEFELLFLLISNPGVVLSREKIIDKIWGYDFDGATRTIDVHIASIRQKIEPYGNIIKTVRSLGYKVGDD